jgi:hypothetical protein
MKNAIRTFICFIVVAGSFTALARAADEVTQWNQYMLDAFITANVTGVVPTRHAALVSSAVYDAVNGIERRFTPVHVPPAAPPGASVRAATVQAAYQALVTLFPAQKSDLDAKRAASLAAIASDQAVEHSQSIARGIEWGTTVANEILLWRSTDGFSPAPPPNTGGTNPGQWRPTPPGLLPFGALQFANMVPWVIQSPAQFPLPGPPALTSAKYTADFNEVKQLGSINSVARTAAETALATFWASANSPPYFWDRAIVRLSEERHLTISENARLLAMANVAIADAGIAVWKSKLTYMFWRPLTAIQEAANDGNPATTPDPAWTPLLVNPPYPDYVSGLVGTSSGGATVLEGYFGADASFILDSNGQPGVVRFFANVDAALDEAVNARIFSGIHFRSADEDARTLGTAIAHYIMNNAFLPVNGKRNGQLGK